MDHENNDHANTEHTEQQGSGNEGSGNEGSGNEGSPHEHDPRARRRRSPLVRGVLLGLSLIAAWHIFASFLWIAPYSSLREIPGQKALSSYMIPFFGQSWSVFAPEPINGSYTFKVRALVDAGDGNAVETEWVDATAVELSMVQYNLFPPRAGLQAGELASQHKSEFDALSGEHQRVVEDDYPQEDWEASLEEALLGLGDAELVGSYLETEHMATAYATQVALAVWGEDVTSVQYEVSRQNVVPFAERNDSDAQQPSAQIASPGWRGLTKNPGQSDEAFAEVFLRVYERMGS